MTYNTSFNRTRHTPPRQLSYASTVKRYYEKRSVQVTGELEAAVEDMNFKALRWVNYAIRYLASVEGMTELLDQLASVKRTGSDSERQFNNRLTEIHAASFLSSVINETVLEVESKSHNVRSPYAVHNRYCDIKTAKDGNKLYYEVKDSSSEITTSYEKHGSAYFKPMDDQKVEQWIKDQTKKADKCGANYLICNVPVWSVENKSKFYKEWVNRIMKKHFCITQKKTKRELIASPTFSVSSHVRGVYILTAFGYIKISFNSI